MSSPISLHGGSDFEATHLEEAYNYGHGHATSVESSSSSSSSASSSSSGGIEVVKVIEAEEVQIVDSDECGAPADEEEAETSTSKQAPRGQKRASGRQADQSARRTSRVRAPSSPDRWRSFDDVDSIQKWFTTLGIDSANYRVRVLDYVIEQNWHEQHRNVSYEVVVVTGAPRARSALGDAVVVVEVNCLHNHSWVFYDSVFTIVSHYVWDKCTVGIFR